MNGHFIAGASPGCYLQAMSKVAVVLAMLLLQVQPVVGAVLCQQHHQVPQAACMTGEGHAEHGVSQVPHHPDQQSADQCAASAACTSVVAVVRPSMRGLTPLEQPAPAGPIAASTLPATGLHSLPFHPPKS